MEVYYLSDGEIPARMNFDTLADNLRMSYAGADPRDLANETGFRTVDELVEDMAGAIDNQGFWHGTLTCYNVAVIGVHKIQRLDAEYEKRKPDGPDPQ